MGANYLSMLVLLLLPEIALSSSPNSGTLLGSSLKTKSTSKKNISFRVFLSLQETLFIFMLSNCKELKNELVPIV